MKKILNLYSDAILLTSLYKVQKHIVYKTVLGAAVLAIAALVLTAILNEPLTHAKQESQAVQIMLDWNRFVLHAEVKTPGYRGPVAARAYGYIGLAAYAVARQSMIQDDKILWAYFHGMDLPQEIAPELYDLPVVLNACYATILNSLFSPAYTPLETDMLALRNKWERRMDGRIGTDAFAASTQYGESVARAVYKWSATDSLGYQGHLHNYQRDYIQPHGEGQWVTSPDFPMPPLLPYWGQVRTFVIDASQHLARPVPEYSADKGSLFYAQSLEVLTLSSPLSRENQWIAEFWDDDHPGYTFSPPGHWLAITNQVVAKERPPVEIALETYLKIGFALSDAMIACWYSKYYYNLERPESYIRRHLSCTWQPHAPAPPFPAYPSGHSVMGAAAAEVLTSMYGDNYAMTDHSTEDRTEFKVRPRIFSSFDEMARENALSRILLGVHFRMDCDEGLRLGALIGREIAEMPMYFTESNMALQ